jgi:glycosidase
MAAGLLCMMRGNVFLYYGQEIGMAGSGDDPNKRIGMLWDTEETAILPPPGTTKAEYVFPGVSDQADDPDSILSYYREALAIRNAFPQIARGSSRDAGSEDPRVSLMLRGDEETCILIAANPSKEEASVPLSGEAALYTAIAATLYASEGEASLTSGILTLPAYSIAILSK